MCWQLILLIDLCETNINVKNKRRKGLKGRKDFEYFIFEQLNKNERSMRDRRKSIIDSTNWIFLSHKEIQFKRRFFWVIFEDLSRFCWIRRFSLINRLKIITNIPLSLNNDNVDNRFIDFSELNRFITHG